MVWFSCEDCGDSIKKPKLQGHFGQCAASRLTCIDCNTTFDQEGAKGHSQCVTEKQKYEEGATKHGAKAANGLQKVDSVKTEVPQDAQPADEKPKKKKNLQKDDSVKTEEPQPAQPAEEKPKKKRKKKQIVLEKLPGYEYLATEAPWTCRCCKITCTDQDGMLAHGAGKQHLRRSKGYIPSKAEKAYFNQQKVLRRAAQKEAAGSGASSDDDSDSKKRKADDSGSDTEDEKPSKKAKKHKKEIDVSKIDPAVFSQPKPKKQPNQAKILCTEEECEQRVIRYLKKMCSKSLRKVEINFINSLNPPLNRKEEMKRLLQVTLHKSKLLTTKGAKVRLN